MDFMKNNTQNIRKFPAVIFTFQNKSDRLETITYTVKTYKYTDK